MKAYYLRIEGDDEGGIEVVFADTVRAAKKLIYGTWLGDSLESWLDVRATRAKSFDGLENLSASELALKQWRMGWRWNDMDEPDVDEATDEDFLKWYKENF